MVLYMCLVRTLLPVSNGLCPTILREREREKFRILSFPSYSVPPSILLVLFVCVYLVVVLVSLLLVTANDLFQYQYLCTLDKKSCVDLSTPVPDILKIRSFIVNL